MFNYCVNSIIKLRPFSQCFSVLGKGNRNYASFNVKDVLYEKSEEAGTLLTRFAKHVAIERLKVCNQVPTKVRYADFFPITDVKYFQRELTKTSVDQLAPVIIYASSYRSNAEPVKFASILNELDRYAMEKVHEMDADTILRTLYAFLFLIPNWMTRLDFYTAAMQNLFAIVNEDGCKSKELFVQMSFYFGLSKQQSRSNLNKHWKTFVDSNIDRFLPELSLVDLALVSSAGYKTSTRIDSDDFNQRLAKEILGITSAEGGNDALLITFVKSLRFQRMLSNEVCEHLANICTSPAKLQQFQTRGQVHIFAFFADNLWDNEACTKPMIEEFVKHLKIKIVNYDQSIRCKDIACFLWCCAQLKCSLTNEQLRIIEDGLLRKMRNNEFNYFPDQLVESCLSLWMLGFKSKELLHNAIQLKSETSSKRQQPKVDSRLTVLLSAAQIEEPSWCTHLAKGFSAFNLETEVPSYLLNSQIPYQSIISQLQEGSMVTSVKIASPINGINIPGILVKISSSTDSVLFVEFMTKSQMLQFSQQPVCILRLKLQLLQSIGHKVKVLTSSDFSGPLDVNDLLHDENTRDLNENIIKA